MSVKPTRSTSSRETLYEISSKRKHNKEGFSSMWVCSQSVALLKSRISFRQKENYKTLNKNVKCFSSLALSLGFFHTSNNAYVSFFILSFATRFFAPTSFFFPCVYCLDKRE
jgi:hypothetical protein